MSAPNPRFCVYLRRWTTQGIIESNKWLTLRTGMTYPEAEDFIRRHKNQTILPMFLHSFPVPL